MSQISIPLNIKKGRLVTSKKVTEAINSYVSMLMRTSRHITSIDPEFGFVFNNLKFENFNEKEGVVSGSDSGSNNLTDGLYGKKISGTSKNLNTFAAELKEAISQYEKRLTDVSVNMTYIREERRIYMNIKGTILATKEPYRYATTIKVWH